VSFSENKHESFLESLPKLNGEIQALFESSFIQFTFFKYFSTTFSHQIHQKSSELKKT
jgi:hypothetical protein